MNDNEVHLVDLPSDRVVKGSNYPTPMAIAPADQPVAAPSAPTGQAPEPAPAEPTPPNSSFNAGK